MRASRWKKFRRVLTRGEGKIKPLEILLAIILIVVFYKLAMVFAGYFTNTVPGAV